MTRTPDRQSQQWEADEERRMKYIQFLNRHLNISQSNFEVKLKTLISKSEFLPWC